MAHLDRYLPDDIALQALWSLSFGTQVAEKDSGHEVRNNRWANPKKTLEVPWPVMARDSAVLDEIVDLYEDAAGMLHTFNVRDWRDDSGGTVVRMRFDTALEITAVAVHLEQVGTLRLIEVFA